jgi:hypothetical protein
MYGQRVKQQSNEEYRATMVGKKKEHGKKERGKTQDKKNQQKCKKQSEA